MHCKKCGTALREGAGFCPVCGTPVMSVGGQKKNAPRRQPGFSQNPADPYSVSSLDWINDNSVPKENSDKSWIKWVICIGVSILMVSATVVFLFVFFHNRISVKEGIMVKQEKQQKTEAQSKKDGVSAVVSPSAVPMTPAATSVPAPTATPSPSPKPTARPTSPPASDLSSSQGSSDAVWEGDYLFPESDYAYLSRSQLEGLSAQQLLYARNEIYARHGRKFKDAAIQAYFNSKSWYTPMFDPDDFDSLQDGLFNEYEKRNIQLIRDYEKEKGYQ